MPRPAVRAQLRLLAGTLSHPGLVITRLLAIQLIQSSTDPIPTILAASPLIGKLPAPLVAEQRILGRACAGIS